jgi:surface protein
MTTIADKLTLLGNTKDAIKTAIEAQGVTVGFVPFADYPSKIALIEGGEPTPPAPEPEGWVRPADWLEMPAIEDTDVKFDGLVAVEEFDELNWVTLQFNQPVTIDWGDGSAAENVAANTVAVHQFKWADVDASTLTSRGYRQALVSVVPQSTAFTEIVFNSVGDFPSRKSWIEQQIAMNNTGTIVSNGSSSIILESFRWLGLNSQTTFLSFFSTHRALKNVEISANNVTNMNSMFFNCINLKSILIKNTENVTFVSGMFSNCSSLETVPLFNTSSVTDMFQMFFNCSSLKSVPLFNTANVTGMSNMFRGCSSLETVPLFNTSSVTTLDNMFNGCSSLKSVPLFNTANVTRFDNMFENCSNLESVPEFDFSSANNIIRMFLGCSSLESLPDLNLNNSVFINVFELFRNMRSVRKIKINSLNKSNNYTSLFTDNFLLREIDVGDVSGIINFGGTGGSRWLANANLLSRIKGTGYNALFSVGFSNLGPDALVEIFEGLNDRTGLTSLAVTISGNWGAALLTQAQRDIALNKNWTITG